jgi:hypothetical protein
VEWGGKRGQRVSRGMVKRGEDSKSISTILEQMVGWNRGKWIEK